MSDAAPSADGLAHRLAESEKQLRLYETILATTPDLVYVFDLNHRFTYANDILLKMWGRTWDEAIGKTCLELGYEPWHADMHSREIEQVKATRLPIRGVVPFNGTFGRRFYDYIFAPVFGPDGEVEAIAGTTRDVTDRQNAEDALRKSEAHLQSLFEQSSAGIFETDLQGHIVTVNERFCRMLEIERDALIGRNVYEFAHPDDVPDRFDIIHDVVETQRSFQFDVRYITRDGAHIWTNTSLSLIQSGTETAASSTILAVAIDITARKQIEDALQLADKRKDEFLAMLAHELRNPLAPISAAATLMEIGNIDEERVRRSSQVINRQVKHMVGLVNDLLDMSRVTRGLVHIDHTVHDLKSVIAHSVEQVRPLIDTRRHHLSIESCRNAVHVLGDEKRLVQIFSNLLNNAAKYTPEGGHLHIVLDVTSDAAQVSVIDNGSGIPPDVLPHVFELFAQGQRSPDRAQGGLGIGLALARSLVHLHNGDITCSSNGTGQGSRFTVTLPLANPPSAAEVLSQANAIPESQLKIMVVDDNIDAAQTLSLLLESQGHMVIVEHHPRRALERAKIERPEVCLLDIGLPEMDGNELARRLRAQSETASTILVAITGYGQAHDREYALDSGFHHYMVKPVESDTLCQLLARIPGNPQQETAL